MGLRTERLAKKPAILTALGQSSSQLESTAENHVDELHRRLAPQWREGGGWCIASTG